MRILDSSLCTTVLSFVSLQVTSYRSHYWAREIGEILNSPWNSNFFRVAHEQILALSNLESNAVSLKVSKSTWLQYGYRVAIYLENDVKCIHYYDDDVMNNATAHLEEVLLHLCLLVVSKMSLVLPWQPPADNNVCFCLVKEYYLYICWKIKLLLQDDRGVLY